MTYKEKAIELVNKFDNYTSYEWWEGENGHKENMKQCALIHIEELLNLTWYMQNDRQKYDWESEWKEVKKEIEAL